MNATGTAAGASVNGQAGAGQLQLLDAGSNVLVTFTLQQPPFTIAAGVATLLGTPLTAVASGSGSAASAQFLDGGGNVVGGGMTVGLISGFDVNITTGSLVFTAGQTETIGASSTITTTSLAALGGGSGGPTSMFDFSNSVDEVNLETML